MPQPALTVFLIIAAIAIVVVLIAVIVIGIFIIKKVASCLIRTVVIFLLLGALLFLCTLLGWL